MWDALCLAAEWRSIGREADAALVMPEPEAKWVRFILRARYPLFFERPSEEWDDPQPPRGEQIREHRARWDRRDWLAWVNGGAFGYGLNLTSFDSILREHYDPLEVARLATGRSPSFTFLNPTTFRRLQQRIAPPTLPRAGITAALTALPGYRDETPKKITWWDEAATIRPV
jgi:hypothetical protein